MSFKEKAYEAVKNFGKKVVAGLLIPPLLAAPVDSAFGEDNNYHGANVLRVECQEGQYPPSLTLPSGNLRMLLYPEGSSLPGLDLDHYVHADRLSGIAFGRRPFPADTRSDEARKFVGVLVDQSNSVKSVVIYDEANQDNSVFYPFEFGPDLADHEGTYFEHDKGWWDAANRVKTGEGKDLERNEAGILRKGDKIKFGAEVDDDGNSKIGSDRLVLYDLAGNPVGLEKRLGGYRLSREGEIDPNDVEFKVGFEKYGKEELEGSVVGSRKLRQMQLSESPNAFFIVRESYTDVTFPDGTKGRALESTAPIAYGEIINNDDIFVYGLIGAAALTGAVALSKSGGSGGSDRPCNQDPGGGDNPSNEIGDPDRGGDEVHGTNQSPGNSGSDVGGTNEPVRQ